MAKSKIGEYSATPANNTDIANIDINEGCSPSGINNAIRELMSDLKDWQAGNVSGQALAVVSGGTGAETASAARTNLGAAASGANSDITSLTGLTTPISVAQGGTGYVANRSISAVGRASNVVTITTTAAHGYAVNDIVTVTAVTNTSVNGTFTIASVPSSVTFTYAQTGTDYSSTADTGTVISSSNLQAANISGIIPVIHGGTGASTLKQNNLLVGNGTSAPTVIPAGAAGNVLTSTTASTVTAGSFAVGTEYTIASVGTTDFTAIGASSNTVGVVFTATGAGSGTGTATTNVWASAANVKITSATAQTATGVETSFDFTGIPSTASRITLMMAGISTNGSAKVQVQLIISGTPVTSGYKCTGVPVADTAVNAQSYTSGFVFTFGNSESASYTRHGNMLITKISSTLWSVSGTLADSADNMAITAGSLTISGTLTGVRVTTTGSDVFDAGSVNIMYE